MNAVLLTLPYPPSTNNLFFNLKKGGRAPSDRYKAWATEAGWEAKRQNAGKVTGPYALYITAARPDARKRDLDNLAKPISDLLKTIISASTWTCAGPAAARPSSSTSSRRRRQHEHRQAYSSRSPPRPPRPRGVRD
jgi:hypothetical protein